VISRWQLCCVLPVCCIKTRGVAIKNQLNTEIAACDKKRKEQDHKHVGQFAYSASAGA
jgi:hypothetical protein